MRSGERFSRCIRPGETRLCAPARVSAAASDSRVTTPVANDDVADFTLGRGLPPREGELGKNWSVHAGSQIGRNFLRGVLPPSRHPSATPAPNLTTLAATLVVATPVANDDVARGSEFSSCADTEPDRPIRPCVVF
jgi:hypothetical protein